MSDLDLTQLAKASKLFEALDPEARKELLSRSGRQKFPAGHVLCREGESGDVLYVLAKGEARVSLDDLGEDKEVGRLSAGHFFGEQAMLSGSKRQATVTAVTELEVVSFPRAAVDAVLAKNPSARAVLATVGLQRSEASMQKLME
ncbi:MAG: cyclic nucleotide-binding domain-containing protein [Myxococcales bacterium]|nr:cyclic nucleotide-binding domain-containing protein [Myxococcales bacterium]MDP3499981.1 cyclic nucleotide-binding domain-containing protein [Myxococcales bacterium]